MSLQKCLLMAGLLLNAWAGACRISIQANPDFDRWQALLTDNRALTRNGTAPSSLTTGTLSKYPILTRDEVPDFSQCPGDIQRKFGGKDFPLMACEMVNKPVTEVRALALKAYAGRLAGRTGQILKFAGAGGGWAFDGAFWNGTQLTLMPAQGRTLLLWQSQGRTMVADQVNAYLDSQLNEFFRTHPDFFRAESRPELPCDHFGISSQESFKFRSCFALSQQKGQPPSFRVVFTLSESLDSSLQTGRKYVRIAGGTCGSVIRIY